MRRLIATLAVVATLAPALPAVAIPVTLPIRPVEGVPVPTPPQVTAKSYILYDDTYGVVLASLEPDTQRAPASTTKIMTALVALEAQGPDRVVTVTADAAAVGESEIGLVAGEQFTLERLIEAMMVKSANDAAVAVAEAVGGTIEGFAARMNRLASDLGLTNSNFVNPHGLDDPQQYSSAADLLTLARAAMEWPEFAAIVQETEVRFPPTPDGTERVAEGTNKLLVEYQGAIGVKTGFTNRAGLVLVAAAERNDRRLYAVVMGSEGVGGHFADASALLDYGFDEYGLVSLVTAGRSYGVIRSGDETEDLVATEAVDSLLPLESADLVSPSLGVETGEPVIDAGDAIVAVVPVELDPLPDVESAWAWFVRYLDWFVAAR